MQPLTPPPHRLSSARWNGLRVGILGGSFNPAHEGHLHIARQALIKLKLHAVWWLVSPGNPHKTKAPIGNFAHRLAAVDAFVKHPRMVATGLEAQLGTRYTSDTLRSLCVLFPRTDFVWIAGMDNACSFHRWQGWKALPELVPFVFFDRPPQSSKTKGNRLRQRRGVRQRTNVHARAIKHGEKGVFWMLRGKSVSLSSTALRGKKR